MVLPPALVASSPPIIAVPSEPSERGNSAPASAAACWARASTSPASTVMVMSARSSASTRFIRARLSTTWRGRASGVAPPTMEVLPPCGMMTSPCAAQSFTQADTSAVEAGRSTASASPR